jgi:hypothetical protein
MNVWIFHTAWNILFNIILNEYKTHIARDNKKYFNFFHEEQKIQSFYEIFTINFFLKNYILRYSV